MSGRSLYFQHDSDAKSDPNILRMISKYGYKGYGWYWRLLELMRMEKDWTLDLKDLDGYAMELNANRSETERYLNDCIKTFKLFKCRRTRFWADRLKRDMMYMDEQKQVFSDRGRSGAMKRYSLLEAQPEHAQATAQASLSHGYNIIRYNKIEYEDIYNHFLSYIVMMDGSSNTFGFSVGYNSQTFATRRNFSNEFNNSSL